MKALVSVLKMFSKAIGWIIPNIVGIPLIFALILVDYYKTSIKHQQRLNPPMQGIVKKEIHK